MAGHLQLRSFLPALLLLLAPDAVLAQATDAVGANVLRRRACEFLWSQQSEDGAWHSKTYALLRSGQALTPFVLYALLEGPDRDTVRASPGTRAALAFIRRHTTPEGVLGLADPEILEYPNYATSYALQCLIAPDQPEDRALIAAMRQYLVHQQYREANGFAVTSAAFGGWGFGGVRPHGDPGHMDLAHTRRVLEALRRSESLGSARDNATYKRAEEFLSRVQRRPAHGLETERDESRPSTYDGGFYFSPVVLQANKGRSDKAGEQLYYRSYATATCDGLLSLLAAGVSPSDARVQDAAAWLMAHPELDHPAGVPLDHPEPWPAALRMYHLAVRAEAYAAIGWPDGAAAELVRLLGRWQQDDGSFVNRESGLMKEDDPLLCTALAVIALSHLPPSHDGSAAGGDAALSEN